MYRNVQLDRSHVVVDDGLNSLIAEQVLALTTSGSNDDHSALLRDLLNSIGRFLDSHNMVNVGVVVRRYSQLGKALSLAAHELRRQGGSLSDYDLLVRGARWFHRSDSKDPAQTEVTRQSQRFIRRMVILSGEWMSNGNVVAYGTLLASTPLDSLISNLQAQIFEHLNAETVGHDLIAPLCRLCTTVLNSSGKADPRFLETVLRCLPNVESKTTAKENPLRNLYRTIGQLVDRDRGQFPNSFLSLLAERDVTFLERHILFLFANWMDGAGQTLEEYNWLTTCATTNKKLFQNFNCILHSLLVKLDYHVEAANFVKKILFQIRQATPLENLYPQSLACVFVLLEVQLEGLPHAAIERISIMLLEVILSGLFERTFTVFEIAVLSCHFSDWWTRIQLLSAHIDHQIQFKYRLLENVMFGKQLIAS